MGEDHLVEFAVINLKGIQDRQHAEAEFDKMSLRLKDKMMAKMEALGIIPSDGE